MQAIALTSASASRIERDLPHGVGLFDHYPMVVVSLDYIKSERHREHFLSIAPECIIVDEAHTCASSGAGKQLRFELLQRLAKDPSATCCCSPPRPTRATKSRFTTCCPCSTRRFVGCKTALSRRSPARGAGPPLCAAPPQRHREWQAETGDGRGFARRMKTEAHLQAHGDWGTFFDAVQERIAVNGRNHRANPRQCPPHLVRHAGPVALRGLQPAAAVKALTTRLEGKTSLVAEGEDDLLEDERLHDGQADDLGGSDLEPAGQIGDRWKTPALANPHPRSPAPVRQSRRPQVGHAHRPHGGLVKDGYAPVVFCRYVATAHYVAAELRKALSQSAGGVRSPVNQPRRATRAS
jgi:hypothetical protein